MLKNKQRKMIAAGSAAILAVSAAVSAAPQLSALTVGGPGISTVNPPQSL